MPPPNENAKVTGNSRGNGRTVTTNMFYTMPRLKKCSSKLQSMRQRSHCHRERAPYDAPPEKTEGANDNQRGNGRTVTANVLHTMPHPRKTKGQMAITQKCVVAAVGKKP
jgi:hypothetical protein